jgi:hypothetical protein
MFRQYNSTTSIKTVPCSSMLARRNSVSWSRHSANILIICRRNADPPLFIKIFILLGPVTGIKSFILNSRKLIEAKLMLHRHRKSMQ